MKLRHIPAVLLATLFFAPTISAQTTLDVPEGELWLCSGQSNMELPVRRCLDVIADDVKEYESEDIHYMKVPLSWNFKERQASFNGAKWQTLNLDNVQEWGALCYYIGRGLHEATGKPITIINSSVGGSPVEAWTPEEYLREYAIEKLIDCKNDEWVRQTLSHNRNLYGEWQAELDAKPVNPNAKWRRMPLFSTKWSVDENGEPIFGSHYFRKTVRLSAKMAEGDAIIHLGAIVDADSVFINGVFVGNTTYQYPPRNYKVPAGVLRKGRNVIDIHLQSHAAQPAHFVQDKEYSLETAAGKKSLLKGWKYKEGVRMHERDSEDFLQYKPAGLFNAMIAPLKGLKFKGVVWYQGESNVNNADIYDELLKTMINSWREYFNDPELPFYIVELAAFEHSELETAETSPWVMVQDMQRKVAEDMDNVYLIPNRDCGEWNDIHPQDKKTLGERTVNVILNSNN